MPSELFYLDSLDRSISSRKDVWLYFLITMLYRIPLFNANSADSDYTPRSVAFDLSHLREARHKWVKNNHRL